MTRPNSIANVYHFKSQIQVKCPLLAFIMHAKPVSPLHCHCNLRQACPTAIAVPLVVL